MKILAIETSLGECSVAIYQDHKLLTYLEELQLNQQSQRLIPMIELALVKAKIAYKDLDYIAVGIGPGSFTGIRIGISAALGIRFAKQIKTLGISSLEALAFVEPEKDICAIIDAGREQVYSQRYSKTAPLEIPKIIGIPQLSEVPENFIKIGNKLADINCNSNAKLVGLAALSRIEQNKLTSLKPLYIREADARLSAVSER